MAKEKEKFFIKHFNKAKLGFTLIELLVVISIIGLLSSVVLASLNSARMKARDAKRIEDIRQIQLALEMYYDDNGKYPLTSGGNWVMSNPLSTVSDCGTGYWGNGGASSFTGKMFPYMAQLPNDPLGGKGCTYAINESNNYFNYAYRSIDSTTGYDYELLARLEDTNSLNSCGQKCWARHNTNPSYNSKSWCSGEGSVVCDPVPTDIRSKRIYTGR